MRRNDAARRSAPVSRCISAAANGEPGDPHIGLKYQLGDPAQGDIAEHVVPGNEHDERAWRAEFPLAVARLFDLPPPAKP